AAGKAAICVPCDDAELAGAREQRLPVESVIPTLKEGDYIAGGQGVISLIAPEYRLKDDAVFWENGASVDQESAEATKLLKAILAKRPEERTMLSKEDN